jgi:hypothetical protein
VNEEPGMRLSIATLPEPVARPCYLLLTPW